MQTLLPRRSLGIACLLLGAAGLTAVADEPVRDESRTRVRSGQSFGGQVDAIDGILTAAARDGMNGVLLIRRGNAVVMHEAYGFRDVEKNAPLTIDHGFTIGSIVKPINAVAILKLEAAGKLSTDDTLSKYFADAPADKASITIMQLLTHTAGMQDLFGGDFQVVDRAWLVDRALHAKLIATPGEREQYSNSGYSLLAVIVEKVTGKSFETYVRREVLAPADVTRIGYVLAGWKNADLAVGYTTDGRRWGTLLDKPWADDGPSWNLRGNGGMLGTATELCRWYEALFDGKILEPEALEKFYSFEAGRTRSGAKALAHAGGNRIFNALQVSYIEEDVHVTFFTSHGAHRAEPLWREIREHVRAMRETSSGQ